MANLDSQMSAISLTLFMPFQKLFHPGFGMDRLNSQGHVSARNQLPAGFASDKQQQQRQQQHNRPHSLGSLLGSLAFLLE